MSDVSQLIAQSVNVRGSATLAKDLLITMVRPDSAAGETAPPEVTVPLFFGHARVVTDFIGDIVEFGDANATLQEMLSGHTIAPPDPLVAVLTDATFLDDEEAIAKAVQFLDDSIKLLTKVILAHHSSTNGNARVDAQADTGCAPERTPGVLDGEQDAQADSGCAPERTPGVRKNKHRLRIVDWELHNKPADVSDDEDEDRPPDEYVKYTHGWLKKFASVLTEAERRVYDVLAMFFKPDNDGLVWLGHAQIAEMAGYSRRQTVLEAINSLRTKGLLDVLDYPVTLWKPAKGDQNREMFEVGGGREAGKNNVFMLLHVDEAAYHRPERARPSVAEMMRSQEEGAELNTHLCRMVLRGAAYEDIRAFVVARYPFAAEVPLWAWGGTGDPPDVSLDNTFMASALLPLQSLNHRYPAGGRANMSLAFQRPDSLSTEERGGRYLKPYWAAEEAVRASGEYMEILREAVALHELPIDEARRGGTSRVRELAPTISRLHDELQVIPNYLVSIANDIAIENDLIIVQMREEGPVGINCKRPDQWADKSVVELATIRPDGVTAAQREAYDQTVAQVRDAQIIVLRTFVMKTMPDGRPPEDLDLETMAGFVAKQFNEWVDGKNHTSFEDKSPLLVPLRKVTPQEVLALAHELEATEADPEGADSAARPVLLVGSALKAAEYIRAHENAAGKQVAKAAGVTFAHFRKHIVPKLKALGFRNEGDGYLPPNIAPRARFGRATSV